MKHNWLSAEQEGLLIFQPQVEGFDPFLFWLIIVAPPELIHSQVPDGYSVCAQAGPCSTVMATFPFLRPVSTYRCASAICSKG